jgi:transposase
MPRAYSSGLRRRDHAAVLEGGQSRDVVAPRFLVGRSTVYRWGEVAQSEGRLRFKPTIRDAGEATRRRLVANDNHLSLAEYRYRLAEETGVRVHPWTLGRTFKRLGVIRNKEELRAAELAEVEQACAALAPERLVFLDETAALTHLARLHDWSPRGERALGVAPCGQWEWVTILGALGCQGIVGARSIVAATDEAVFLAYLERVLLPKLRRVKPDAVLVMDTGRQRRPGRPQDPGWARAARRLGGFGYHYLPSSSPDLNPIELAWAKVKASLRQAAARTVDALHAALGPALAAITAQDAKGYFRHAGYAFPN